MHSGCCTPLLYVARQGLDDLVKAFKGQRQLMRGTGPVRIVMASVELAVGTLNTRPACCDGFGRMGVMRPGDVGVFENDGAGS